MAGSLHESAKPAPVPDPGVPAEVHTPDDNDRERHPALGRCR